MRIVIIGAGIGGTAAAIALLRRGFEVELHERFAAVREVGAGIVLWGNAIAALRAIGVADSIVARGGLLQRGELRSARGELLSAQRVDEWDRELGEPSIVLHRADLLQALHAELPAGALRLGKRCIGVGEAGAQAVARFDDGSEAVGDVVVGADGIDSAVRHALRPAEGAPRYAGCTCWRAVVDFAFGVVPAGYLNETWGRGRRFGLLRLSATRVYWFATVDAPRGERDLTPWAAKQQLGALFGGWWGPIPALIAATPPAAIIRHDLVDRPPIRRWGRGAITLLGDAAHPTTPNVGQGACLAIEDAQVLAEALARQTTVRDALRHYERARQPRTAEITRFSWHLGRAGQFSAAPLAWMRDRLLAATPLAAIRRQHRRYVGFRAGTPDTL